ncbi:type IV pilin N-terminal domain-containing protein [Haladaptatus sp. AB643]|uniref:type IV pilin n=1 Tax=Haladaptatus sp. AB643 TaxID=2934174 RepID=UPI00209BC1BF|nr:type IV pilin N-terminal domain-containing protein [Haladaptatus sp. AB643]MCO8246987.1 type IV pilin N-terminal domain-containing protein [Haladaptatus sp. AB643]
MTLKERFNSKLSSSRGVSPVIGVILMVAITVILAAVIGTFVMGLGNNVDKNAQVGVSFDQVSSNSVDVQLTQLGNVQSAENVSVTSQDCEVDGDGKFNEVGGIISVSKCESGDKIVVKATVSGKPSVVSTYTVN